VIDTVVDSVWLGLSESATVAVKLNVPTAVGVPEINPVDAARERPAGNCPAVIDQVYPGWPPTAFNELE
jgi:hypothetical protein